MAYFDILILAAVAAFLGYRLWSILGTHDPDKPVKPKGQPFTEEADIPVRPTQRHQVFDEEDESFYTFNRIEFIEGAEVAFRMIVIAFAEGDKSTLKKLLSKDVYDSFVQAIDEREKAKQNLELEVARIVQAEVIKEIESDVLMEVTVKFISEQCSITYDKKGKILSGNPEQFHEITDIWTFTHEKSSPNPNWTVTSTQADFEDEDEEEA